MAFENLSDREKQVLYNLITHYISSADPVGSRVIANRFSMGISSATVRNTLQDLEELGLVEQPHTSAGRVPTDRGYRLYVDYLLRPEELSASEKELIRGSVLKSGRGLSEILGQTSKILGEITHQLGVSIAPKFDRGVLKRLELIPITEERLMVVVVVESGLARSIIIEVETAYTERELRDIEQVLNERLSGLKLGEIRQTMAERLGDVKGEGRLVKLLVDASHTIWTDDRSEGIHLAGAQHLIQHPEFAEVSKISELLRLLENGPAINEFLNETGSETGLVITIGQENRFLEVMNCSVVASSYRVGNISGTIGIIGPTRMPYSKLSSIVDYTARTISEALAGIEHKEGE